MLYGNAKVIAASVLEKEPKVQTILIQVEGMDGHRLAIEPNGSVSARGERLKFSEYVPWAQSAFGEYDPERVIADMIDANRLKAVSVISFDNKKKEVKEFPAWEDFCGWLGKQSDQIDWRDCQITSVYLTRPLYIAVLELVKEHKTSMRKIVLEAIEQYLERQGRGGPSAG